MMRHREARIELAGGSSTICIICLPWLRGYEKKQFSPFDAEFSYRQNMAKPRAEDPFPIISPWVYARAGSYGFHLKVLPRAAELLQ